MGPFLVLFRWTTPDPRNAGGVAQARVDKDPARRVIDRHIVIIGDAAHPMNPFQGQGANMAIRDAVKVAEFFAGDVTDPKRADGGHRPGES